MMWTPDPAIEAARKLPDWKAFHTACGQAGLCFDLPSRDKNRGPSTVIAWHPKKNDHGGFDSYELARATHKSLLTAMKQAHDESGRGSTMTTALLERMINPVVEPVPDPLAEMFGDPLEGMFG